MILRERILTVIKIMFLFICALIRILLGEDFTVVNNETKIKQTEVRVFEDAELTMDTKQQIKNEPLLFSN